MRRDKQYLVEFSDGPMAGRTEHLDDVPDVLEREGVVYARVGVQHGRAPYRVVVRQSEPPRDGAAV